MYDRLATAYADSKQTTKAEETLERKIRNNPDNFEYMLQLAEFQRTTGNAAAESATLAKLTQNSERTPSVHLLLGDYYSRTGRTDTAIGEYRTGAGKLTGPFQQACQAKAATLLLSRGQMAEAKSLATQLRKASPEDPECPSALWIGNDLRCRCATLDKLIHELEVYMGTTKGLDTRAVQARCPRRTLRAQLSVRDISNCSAEIIQALSTRERLLSVVEMATVEGQLILAKAINRLGRATEARELLTKLVRAYPENAEIHYQLGMLLFGNKDYGSAVRELDAASGRR